MEEHSAHKRSFALDDVMDHTHLTKVHRRIWILSAAGILLDGFDLFVIGICMPLLVKHFNALPWQAGLIGAAAIIGSVLGAAILGPITDRFGRKTLFLFDMMVLIAFAVLAGFAWSITTLLIFRFFIGIGVGADYPICAAYVSEFMPKRIRGKMLSSALSLQAVGMLMAAGMGLLVLSIYPEIQAWRWMMALGAVPAAVILFFRSAVPESVRWLIQKGRMNEAVDIVHEIFPSKRAKIRELLRGQREKDKIERKTSFRYRDLFSKKFIRRTMLASVPWFLMDISTYGVGLFTPTILAAMVYSNATGNYIMQDVFAIKGAAFLDIFLIIGFALNIWLVERWGRITLQLMGFIGMFVGLLTLAVAAFLPGTDNIILVFTGFIIFNVMMNAGPNPTTFTIAAEIFPTELRASGHGFAAALAKVGAAIGIFFLPVLKAALGISWTLLIISCAPLLGMMVTSVLRIETQGRSLEEIQGVE